MGAQSRYEGLDSVLDEIFEVELKQDPHRPKIWLAYIEKIPLSNRKPRWLMYERSLKVLPRSYKIWRRYLNERREQIGKLEYIPRDIYEEMNEVYERALVYLHKMPRVWMDYLQFLILQRKVKKTRETLDYSIRTLPVHQHYRMWNIIIPWLKEAYVTNCNVCYASIILQRSTVSRELVL